MDPRAYAEIAKVENKHWWFVARRNIISSIIGELKLPKNAKILELGAGTGGNLNMLQKFGETYAGEMDDYARRFAKAQTFERVPVEFARCPDTIPFEDIKFDLICMFDVLEHVEFDKETLRVVRERLAPGGLLLVTVPAYEWMWSGHDEFLHHHRRYSSRRLRADLLDAGYSIERTTYFNSLLFPLAAAVRLKDRMAPKNYANVNELPPAPVNWTFRNVFASEAALLKKINLPFGVSLMAIAKNA